MGSLIGAFGFFLPCLMLGVDCWELGGSVVLSVDSDVAAWLLALCSAVDSLSTGLLGFLNGRFAMSWILFFWEKWHFSC